MLADNFEHQFCGIATLFAALETLIAMAEKGTAGNANVL